MEEVNLFLDIKRVSESLHLRPDVYVRILKSFAHGTLAEKNLQLIEAFANNDVMKMRAILHELRGASGNLRVDNVFQAVVNLHDAVKAGEGKEKIKKLLDAVRIRTGELQKFVAQATQKLWKVLIVDDNPESRQLITEILSELAYCVAVGTAKEAILNYNLSLKKEPFNLILMDIEMPEINGLELLKKIRESEKLVGISLGDGVQIIMVTAHEKPFLDAFEFGCDDYVLKPIDPDKLIAKIQQKLIKLK